MGPKFHSLFFLLLASVVVNGMGGEKWREDIRKQNNPRANDYLGLCLGLFFFFFFFFFFLVLNVDIIRTSRLHARHSPNHHNSTSFQWNALLLSKNAGCGTIVVLITSRSTFHKVMSRRLLDHRPHIRTSFVFSMPKRERDSPLHRLFGKEEKKKRETRGGYLLLLIGL